MSLTATLRVSFTDESVDEVMHGESPSAQAQIASELIKSELMGVIGEACNPEDGVFDRIDVDWHVMDLRISELMKLSEFEPVSVEVELELVGRDNPQLLLNAARRLGDIEAVV